MRTDGRTADEPRPISITPDYMPTAEGSALSEVGNTKIICTASVDEGVPAFMRGSGRGWVTAEYAMLPRATTTRKQREVSRGRPSGRTSEIQRLIGRSLRAVTNLKAMGERQIRVDCDVLQADGGTRTASITGAWVALHIALAGMLKQGLLEKMPLTDHVAAVSCGLYKDTAVLDLDYAEDSNAQADANFVLTGNGGIVEIQGTAEEDPFTRAQFDNLLILAEQGIGNLVGLQKQAIEV